MFSWRSLFFSSRASAVLMSVSCIMGLSACNSNETGTPGQVQGQDQIVHAPIVIPSSSSSDTSQTSIDSDTPEPSPSDVVSVPTSTPSPTTSPSPEASPTSSPTPSPSPTTLGPACHGDNAQTFCLGVKYVVYKDTAGKAVVNEAETLSNLATINKIWSQCKITFQIDTYLAANPTQYGLRFNTANNSELDDIRETFQDDNHLLLVTTGSWNRSGSLGSTGANAWANMPGDSILGVVMESDVGTYPNLIAHELGHYLNLDHAGDSTNLLSPIIYSTSTSLTTGQCNEAKAAIKGYWKAMLR